MSMREGYMATVEALIASGKLGGAERAAAICAEPAITEYEELPELPPEIIEGVIRKGGKLLVAGATDAAVEKHVPVVTVEGEDVTARVGAVDHPMLDVHYIEWIAFADGTKLAFKYLKPGDAPEVFFAGEHGTVYAYCNLHGLWKAEF